MQQSAHGNTYHFIFFNMDSLVTLNEVLTKILTWGEPFDSKGTDVIICISGNPGIVDFYTEFGSLLHANTHLPVCVIGQAGHEEVADKRSNQLKDQEHLFNLDAQIKHKLDLITKHIDKDSKLHLIGHSIGSWLIIEMLQSSESLIERVSSVNMLFPTVQRMAETENGHFVNNFRRYTIMTTLIYMFLYVVPEFILRQAVVLYMKLKNMPSIYTEAVMKFVRPSVIEKVLFLAYNEMDRVRALNVKTIEKVKGQTLVLYSPKDGWVPLHFMEEFKQFQPILQMKELNVEHAFVLHSSERVADIVSDFVKLKISVPFPHVKN